MDHVGNEGTMTSRKSKLVKVQPWREQDMFLYKGQSLLNNTKKSEQINVRKMHDVISE